MTGPAEKPWSEWELRECDHCKGSLGIRMPIPSSGCDHLYYPDNCATCRIKHGQPDTNALKDQITAAQERIARLEEAARNMEVAFKNFFNNELFQREISQWSAAALTASLALAEALHPGTKEKA